MLSNYFIIRISSLQTFLLIRGVQIRILSPFLSHSWMWMRGVTGAIINLLGRDEGSRPIFNFSLLMQAKDHFSVS